MIEGKSASSERALLVGLIHREQPRDKMEEYLAELAFLVETAGAICVERAHQKLDRPHPAYFIGPGKLEEIRLRAAELNIDLVVFDDELSPSQLKNIEKEFNPKEFENNVKIMDRTNLILDIFAQRARTAHAKTQVELAQYQYLLPRLTRMWTHLERQKGGIGLRGPGETEIETDRRIIRDKIALLKTRLGTIDKQMQTQRKNRGELVRVALVGYTNVGKSTLMNLLSKSEVFAENKLFATLDTTVRKVVVENLPFLLSDTVGFIRKLPTQLVESFKSTLDEVRESDLLLHVVDVSHPQFEDHVQVVQRTLNEIGAGEKPTLMVFNKVDAYRPADVDPHDLTHIPVGPQNLEELQRIWLAQGADEAIFVSATQRLNLDEFRATLYRRISQIHRERYPYNNFLY